MSWWNDTYLNRKEISLSSVSNSVSGSLVQVAIASSDLVTNGVVRSDYEDIEIVYETNDATPSYVVLGRDVTASTLYFESYKTLPDSGKVYMYYDNPTLSAAPARPSYAFNLYPVTATYNSPGVSYTRPQEHWIDGASSTRNATASFNFYGTNLSIIFETGPQGGLATVSVDGASPVSIDSYASSVSQLSLYNTTALSSGKHEVKIKVLGEHNPTSTASTIRLVSFNYAGDITAAALVEEINESNWTSYFGGV